jgi:predicted ATPase
VVSPVFIGRGAELGRMEAALVGAVAGEPAVVIVAGEAGVGKSRLVAELLGARAPADARVLAGECSGFAPGSLPYEPVVRLLRALVRSGGGVAELPGVAQPALRLLLPELGSAGEATAAGRGPPEQAQVFSQLEAVFDTAAAAAPLVLVIEDLHWADRSSLEFLA